MMCHPALHYAVKVLVALGAIVIGAMAFGYDLFTYLAAHDMAMVVRPLEILIGAAGLMEAISVVVPHCCTAMHNQCR